MSQKTWGGRFTGSTDQRVEAFTESISYDQRLYAQDMTASSAHAQMLAEVGLLSREEAAQILAKHTTVKDLSLYDRIVAAGLDPDGRLNVQGVRDDLALFGRQGCLTGDVADVSRVVDESFTTYAASVLGPYQR